MPERLAQSLLEQGVISLAFFLVLMWVLTRFTSDLSKISRALDVNTAALITLSKMVAVHDAQVRGINPTVGDGDLERDSKAYPVYKRMIEDLDVVIRILREHADERPNRGRIASLFSSLGGGDR